MSTWNLGAGDVSEETRTLRDKLASKEGHIAAQKDQIARQGNEIEELREKLNQVIHKLSSETERTVQLEKDLQQRTEELKNEKLSSANAKVALEHTQGRVKDSGLEMRELQATLERMSHASEEQKQRFSKLEKEKGMLELRVREMEVELRQASSVPTTTPARHTHRPRSSSLSNFRITTLEQDLTECKSLLAKKDVELQSATQRAARAQADLIKADNEKVASERKWANQLKELKAELEEKEEELGFLRTQQGDGSREEELLLRIEEDDAKIAVLEAMVREGGDSRKLKDRLELVEAQLREKEREFAEFEARQIELIKEKEEALDSLEVERCHSDELLRRLREKEARDQALNAKAVKTLETCENPLMQDDSCLIEMETLEPDASQPSSSPPPAIPDADTLTYIERLLGAVERLRSERDGLRRDLEFLESESRFTIEALEAKLSASLCASFTATDSSLGTIGKLKTEMDELNVRLLGAYSEKQETLSRLDAQTKRSALIIQGLAVVVNHAASRSSVFPGSLHPSSSSLPLQTQKVLEDVDRKEMEQGLETLSLERDGLLTQLRAKEAQWEDHIEELRSAERDARDQLDDALRQVSELTMHLEDAETDRDSLTVELANLNTEMEGLRHQLNDAESRYANLQFHQLNAMSSNEVVQTLRQRIEELDQRIMRRNEQIGVHQHDVRRLETNLKLSEERLAELTSELETMGAEKDAMIEDCAEAREARDEAIHRIETLEEELEVAETSQQEQAKLVTTLIAVIADTCCRARQSIQSLKAQVEHYREIGDNDRQRLVNDTEELGEGLRKVSVLLASCQRDLRDKSSSLQDLQAKLDEQQSQSNQEHNDEYEATLQEIRAENELLRQRLKDQESRLSSGNDEDALVQLRAQHADAIGTIQAQLAQAQSSLEELQGLHTSSVEDHNKAVEEYQMRIRTLEETLSKSDEDIRELQRLRDSQKSEEDDRQHQITELEAELKRVVDAHHELEGLYNTLEMENARLSEDFDRLQEEHAADMAQAQNGGEDLRKDLERKVSSLQGRFEEESRMLELAKETAARLQSRLQEESDGRLQDREAHDIALQELEDRDAQMTEELSRLQDDMGVLRGELEGVRRALEASEDEKVTLQEQITSLEAEVQRSKSLDRYLETQIKDSEKVVAGLKQELENIRSALATSEKACKAAEMNFSLQSAQHKRETAEMQRELLALKSRPNFEQALRDLEERNNEMEELLRNKCAEIEENDDRVLEMMKEKKKLTTKVESLSRKVQNLQAKLAAAKAVAPVHAPPESSSSPAPQTTQGETISATISRPRSVTHSSVPPVPPIPAFAHNTPPSAVSRQPSSRAVSGPSSLPRPKTPEATRSTITPVFKARTPERHISPKPDPMPSATVIGKKRAAPDDFEAYENIPTQAFTPDGEDMDKRTPRVRRMLSSLQSGFTPVRNQMRPTANMPSPKRSPKRSQPPRPSPFMSDLTNSPFHVAPVNPGPNSAKPSKRSWLGKIRGSAQAVDRGGTSRAMFDKSEP
ncbi:hypothetical protein CVT24_009782 [Panaeolus cyanescens]|uniref:Uncharacterized protein n=1 Tax=Panaeolus cyanescens TaxID=181874 RepID=A0A409VAD7_9AGAR|nr:hypothetical protein CVT24_009782 [Panaeolus cyanescens]